MSPETPPAHLLASAARRVQRRLFWVEGTRMLAHSAPWAAGVILAAVFGFRMLDMDYWSTAVPAGMFMLWLVATGVAAHIVKPTPFNALARWDAATGRREAAASAWSFVNQPDIGVGGQLHINETVKWLSAELSQIRRRLPLAAGVWRLTLPILAIFGIGTPWLKTRISEAAPAPPQMLAKSKEEARRLDAASDRTLEKLAGLQPAEHQALEALKEAMNRLEPELDAANGKPASEVLSAMEQRAAAAEDLARQIGNDTEIWASDVLLGELRRHADTAAMAAAVRDRAAAQVAAEAENLDAMTRNQRLDSRQVQRLEAAMNRLPEIATAEDAKRPLGRHLSAAARELSASVPDGAAREFAELAVHFRRLAERDEARKKLEQLAQQIRDAAGDAAQQNGEANGAKDAALGEKSLAAVPSGGKPFVPVPEMFQEPDESTDEEESGAGEEGEEMLAAPVPEKLEAGEFDPDKKQMLLAGQNRSANGQTSTGDAPGQGKGAKTGDAEKPLEASREGHVDAAAGETGTTETRNVAAQPRAQNASREARNITRDFVRAQEAALDPESVPPSRREAVRRYFKALRAQFETPEADHDR